MEQNKKFSLIAPIYGSIHVGARRTARKVLRLGEFKKDDIVLDLGGGIGRIAKYLSPAVKKVVVADVAEGMVRECRQSTSLECVLLDGESLPFPDASFDKVLMVDAFHHFADQSSSLSEISRVLRPGGRVVLDEINTDKLYGKFVLLVENLAGFTHRFFVPEELKEYFEQHGFRATLHDAHRGAYVLVAEK